MIPKEFDSIAKEDIDALVTNAVSEGRTIEYKEVLPGGTDDEKKEFLADASSLANAAGGDLVYGIREKRDAAGKPTGVPETALGLAGINPDQEKRRLEDMLRAGIDPRIPAVRMKHVDGFPSGPAIIVRFPKSWASPHMVTLKNWSRFFSRTSAGKHQLDVQEIRAGFIASETLADRLRAFRAERLGKIFAYDTPVPLQPGARVILHLVPFTAADSSANVDLLPLFQAPQRARPLQGPVASARLNFDGFLTYSQFRPDQPSYTYLQVFRSGAFEAVNTEILTQRDGMKLIPTTGFETLMLDGLTGYLAAARELGISPPMALLVTLHGVKGYGLARNEPWAIFEGQPIDRDTLLLPEALIEDLSISPEIVLKPIFDTIWQAAGLPGCEHYINQGRWVGGRSNVPGAR